MTNIEVYASEEWINTPGEQTSNNWCQRELIGAKCFHLIGVFVFESANPFYKMPSGTVHKKYLGHKILPWGIANAPSGDDGHDDVMIMPKSRESNSSSLLRDN
jgi:hypothetical protein